MPALVDATFTDEQTRSVCESTTGSERSSAPGVFFAISQVPSASSVISNSGR